MHLLSVILLAATVSHAFPFRIASDILECTYVIKFESGVDTLAVFDSHFAQLPTPVRHSIRTHASNRTSRLFPDIVSTKSGLNLGLSALLLYKISPSIPIRLALGGGFGPGFKVAGGYDLVGDGYYSGNSTTVPDNDPIYNCSSIIAGDARNITTPEFIPGVPFTGVAPDATLYAYRIFGCNADNTGTDIIAAALYRAAEDGAQVINLSVAGANLSRLRAEVSATGHFLFHIAGNDGTSGAFADSAVSADKLSHLAEPSKS
ncbi:hypothetical protein HK100_001368 [Physocladia obscura]|uniref:Peptidase S8/S53 domain-containing protein n=1 Tax=Physocladia obscura TaxID=109957 RepID=A0AAD5XEK2_9FUNG|nr:hypothetical protein HK100_001368 [Physocladia obscura]